MNEDDNALVGLRKWLDEDGCHWGEHERGIAAAFDRIEALTAEVEGLRKAGRSILPYLEWTLSPESLGYHPTLPSAVYELRAALEGKQ